MILFYEAFINNYEDVYLKGNKPASILQKKTNQFKQIWDLEQEEKECELLQ